MALTAPKPLGSSIDSQSYGEQDLPTHATTNVAVSTDGSRIVFHSKAALTEGADEGEQNVYEYEGGENPVEPGAPGVVYLIASNIVDVGNISLDSIGCIDVFFETVDRLLTVRRRYQG